MTDNRRPITEDRPHASEQDQFLDVVDRDTAERRWRAAIRPRQLPAQRVPLAEAPGRVLAGDVASEVDVPAFDRSNLDGYALRAEETCGAAEEVPRLFRLNPEELATGVLPRITVGPGTATPIATGGMLPRGADAVVMVELTSLDDNGLRVKKPIAPGGGVSFAGTDIARGETVLRRGTRLTSRETAVLAAIGQGAVDVVLRPRVAVLSTGNELIEPGRPPRPGGVYDSNATALADALRELGAEPIALGIVPDDIASLDAALDRAIERADVVLLSGGTSKGAGDVSYRVLARRRPGIVVHGVALKPGKPICLGAVGRVPVVVLPGFPTSAIFTFHEFVAPLIRTLAGLDDEARETIPARLAHRVNSERGRTEYVLVHLVDGRSGVTAYPMGKGSGSVSAFARADGFVVVPKEREFADDGELAAVVPIGRGTRPADLVVIGSHCLGLDMLLGVLAEAGFTSKTIWVGSEGGLTAAGRQECDVAGTHLLDPTSGAYNLPFLPPGVRLQPGYGRMQGIVFRPGDARFEGRDGREAVAAARLDPECLLVNRNRGSGTRVLLDRLLDGARPPGYSVQVRSHHAVASAVASGRADWGVAIAPVAALYGLGFRPLGEERFDFAIPAERWDRAPVAAFRALLTRPDVAGRLMEMGFPLAEVCR
jgi:putative molybdopterin biosynthesis protein